MEFISTFDKHKKEPETTVYEYLRRKCIQLGKYVLTRKIVYLDTKFWIIIRDVSIGRRTTKIEKGFYRKVIELEQQGKCIFPINEDIFIEVFKQTDPMTLDETLRLIDLLSKGVSLINLDDRISLEILHFMLKSTGSDVYDCNDLIWTKVSYNMGFVTPSNDKLDKATDQLIQKAFIDQMWSISLRDMVKIMRKNGGHKPPKMHSIANSLNEGKFQHTHENSSFQEMFLSELAGMLDVYKSGFPEIMAKIYKQKTGKTATEGEIKNSEAEGLVSNMIYNLFKMDKVHDELPTFRVLSGLYAATRWDKAQKFEDNDLHDFRHAAAALPYADYFFTEKGLAHLLTQSSTAYDKLYRCNVQSKIKGAYEVLSDIKG